MRRPDASGRAALAAYRKGAPRDRLHTAVRWWTCPFPSVASELPATGRVLDLGCGHGLFSLYLAGESAGSTVLGVDVDPSKVAAADAAAARSGVADRVEFRLVDTAWRPPRATFDAVVVVDMLYLLGRDRAAGVLADAAAALTAGGVLVVKEMSADPPWKRRVNELQEQVAVKVLGLTSGEVVDVVPVDFIEACLRSSGLDIERRRIDHGYLHPHLVIVGRR